MSFKQPFRAKPIVLGPYWREEQKNAARKNVIRRAAVSLGVLSLAALAGLAAANWSSLVRTIPVYYADCASARQAGAAPISRDSPGYRSALDADHDGIACEPYVVD